MNYLTGETNTFRFEIWLLVVVVIQIVLNQEIGFEEKAEMNFENVNLAFVRVNLVVAQLDIITLPSCLFRKS